MPPVVESLLNELRTESPSTSRFAGRHIHFIGIGGCGMSGLARMLLDNGAIITGSEPKPNSVTLELAQYGAKISPDQTGQSLASEIDLVVRTAAIKDENPEYQAARASGIKCVKYAQMLGEVMKERFGVAVAGTHGKSTTTAMTAYALTQCGADPSFVVGGTVPQLGGGSHSGSGKAFIVEACEFDRSFHNLHPKVALVTNIEADHLDCYKNLDDIIQSFRHFAQLVPHDGLIIANGADPNVIHALEGITTPIERVALTDGHTWSTRVIGIEAGRYCGHVLYKGKPAATLRLSVAGEHNLFDATMAVAACAACGVSPVQAAEALGAFTGVDRRMSEIGRYHGATIVDDYGHHPTEIRATLKALREKYHPRRLFCAFQPHQHSRTRFLLDEFATCFENADQTLIADIYFVRDSETERQKISSHDLVERIRRNGQDALHLSTFPQIADHLRKEAAPGDLILTIGAGNIWEIGHELAER